MDRLTLELNLLTCKRRFFLLEAIRELGTVDHRQEITFFHPIARVRHKRDRAGIGGIERRADGGHHPALHGHVTDQVPAFYRCKTQPVSIDTILGRHPANEHRNGKDEEDEHTRNAGNPLPAMSARGRVDAHVLSRGIGNLQSFHGHLTGIRDVVGIVILT